MSSYSEVTGITQTARNFRASLGLAVWFPRGRVELPKEEQSDRLTAAHTGSSQRA